MATAPTSPPQVAWSEEQQRYQLSHTTDAQHTFSAPDEHTWLAWLAAQTSISFRGQAGHLYAVKEARKRGTGYWYAYRTNGQQTGKRYLGKTAAVTLARLEEVASLLAHHPAQNKQGEKNEFQFRKSATTALPLSIIPESLVNTLLLPKLSPPRQPITLVARERLLEMMDQALTHNLTLLSASAGFGKTTLLSAWVARCPCPVAWLSLEEQDNDPTRFWTHIIAALGTAEPKCAVTALSMLQAPQPPALTTVLTVLLNDLVQSEQQIVLVLDDYHVIDHQAILDTFQFFLEHLPRYLHLVVAGRTDPPLSLPRLRARGHVLELRDRELRFTQTETARFLTQAMQLSLTEEEVAVRRSSTEGWIASLQLAALAMRAREDHSAFVRQLSGGQSYILEYMQEEILERQPVKHQDFLLQTAILARLNASLCQAVTAEESPLSSQQMLETLEKANLFLVPLDEERKWYRFHSLFRDMLQIRLHAIYPERIALLHQRAAHWYARQGNTFEAVEHALAGTDYAFAADLMERSAAQMWSDGKGELLSTWLKRLPDPFLLTHGRLVLTGCLYLLTHAFYALDEQWNVAVKNAKQTITHMEQLLERQEAVALPEARLLHNRIALLREWIATRDILGQSYIVQERNRTVQMHELAREDDIVWKMVPLFNSVPWEANIVALLPMFFELQQQAEQEHHEYEAIRIMAWISWAYEQQGQLHQSERISQEGLQRVKQMGKARAMFGYFHLYLAQFQWQWNQLEETQAHLNTAMQFARTWQHVDIQIKGHYMFFQILLARGELVEAEQVLAEAEQYIQQSQKDLLRYWTRVMRGQFWLAKGDLAAAADWAMHVAGHLPPINLYYKSDEECITLIRVYLALGRITEALQLLAELLSQAEQIQRKWDTISFLALQVVALHLSGEIAQARQVAACLLALAEPSGYIRLFLEAGKSMQEVLQTFLDPQITRGSSYHVVSRPYVITLLEAFEQEATRESQVPALLMPATRSQDASLSSLPEPLTPREQEVLQLIASGATNQEIADHLVIQISTAKKHVSNILHKLGAENRTQAIAHARADSLL